MRAETRIEPGSAAEQRVGVAGPLLVQVLQLGMACAHETQVEALRER